MRSQNTIGQTKKSNRNGHYFYTPIISIGYGMEFVGSRWDFLVAGENVPAGSANQPRNAGDDCENYEGDGMSRRRHVANYR